MAGVKWGNSNYYSGPHKRNTSLPIKYSYSGSDVNGWWVVEKENNEGFDRAPIESLSTVSLQIYEPIGRARALGYRSVRGFASSIREIAGTIIVTVIDDNPLGALMELTAGREQSVRFSHDLKNGFGVGSFTDLKIMLAAADQDQQLSIVNKIAPLIPSFNLFLEYVSEYYDPKVKSKFNQFAYGMRYTSDHDFNTGVGDDPNTASVIDNRMRTELSNNYARSNNLQDSSELTAAGRQRLREAARQELLTNPDDPNEVIVNKSDFKEQYQRDWETKVKSLNYDNNIPKSELEIQVQDQGRNFASVGLYIEGIKFISEGIVTSVNDMVTEISYQFIAQDVKPLSKLNRLARQDEALYNHLARTLADPKSDTYQMLTDLEANPTIDNADIVLSRTADGTLKMNLKTDGTFGQVGFTTKKKKREDEDNK